MSQKVFANGKGISAKKDDNKSLCAMPDVCNSPPSPPAGPIPIPYPNTAMASDTSGGSKTVKIGGGEVGMKNSSNYKKSTGDEPATKGLGMNLTTHTIQGKMKHAAWSMDVKIEGANAIRHMDMTTHNHMNTSGTGSMTINQELEMRAQFEELDCEQLEAGMTEMQTQEIARDDDDEASHALANAHYQPLNGPGSYMRAASDNSMIIDDYTDAYQGSLNPKSERPQCTQIQVRAGRRINDAESKILTPLSTPQFAPDGAFGTQGGSVLMNITHGSSDCSSGQDRMPCLHCRRAICAAEDCGIAVFICTEDADNPVRPASQNLCPPSDTGGKSDPAWASAGMGCRS